MKFSEYLIENKESNLQDMLMRLKNDYHRGNKTKNNNGDIFNYVNNNPSLEAQQFIVDNFLPFQWTWIKKPYPEILKQILTNKYVCKTESDYNTLVRKYFANNQLLINKWIKYGESIRNEL